MAKKSLILMQIWKMMFLGFLIESGRSDDSCPTLPGLDSPVNIFSVFFQGFFKAMQDSNQDSSITLVMLNNREIEDLTTNRFIWRISYNEERMFYIGILSTMTKDDKGNPVHNIIRFIQTSDIRDAQKMLGLYEGSETEVLLCSGLKARFKDYYTKNPFIPMSSDDAKCPASEPLKTAVDIPAAKQQDESQNKLSQELSPSPQPQQKVEVQPSFKLPPLPQSSSTVQPAGKIPTSFPSYSSPQTQNMLTIAKASTISKPQPNYDALASALMEQLRRNQALLPQPLATPIAAVAQIPQLPNLQYNQFNNLSSVPLNARGIQTQSFAFPIQSQQNMMVQNPIFFGSQTQINPGLMQLGQNQYPNSRVFGQSDLNPLNMQLGGHPIQNFYG